MNTRLLLLCMLCLLLPSVSIADDKAKAEPAECFQTKRIHTIRRMDDVHVIAELLGGKRYVLGVESRCRGLDRAVSFTVRTRGTRVCSSSFAELYFSERSGNRSDRCRIKTVEELSDGDAESNEENAAAEAEGG